MKTFTENDVLTICPDGRIDTNNAAKVEEEIFAALDARDPGTDRVIIDAKDLDYISSAGLRVLMKLRKTLGQKLPVVNVSRDVYDIFEVTGFTELFDIKKAWRSISVDGLEVIGRGFYGTVYRLDPETIVKVYKGKDSIPMIENEKKMAQKAFLGGIPTAISYDIVQVGEDYGSVFELLNARTFHEIAQSKEKPLKEIIARYTDLLKLVHQTEMEPGAFPSCRDRFLDYLKTVRIHLSKEQYEGIRKLLSAMPDEHTVVHGDIQMKNVMLVGDEAMLIDMDTLGLGNPVFEFAGLYVTYQAFNEDDPDNAQAFLGMTQQMVEDLWALILDTYFSFRDEEEKESTLAKIRLVAAIRFLYLLESTDLKNSKLGQRRIAHTREHVEELLKTVDHLEL